MPPYYFLIILVYILWPLEKARAIPPPELATGIQNIAAYAALISLGSASAFWGAARTWLKKPLVLAAATLLTLTLAAFSSFFLLNHWQDNRIADQTGRYYVAQYYDHFSKNPNEKNPDPGTIGINDFISLLATGTGDKLIIFDARGYEDFENNHLIGARYWERRLDNSEFEQMASSIDPDVKVIFYCDWGISSAKLAKKFRVYHQNTYSFNNQSFLWLNKYFINDTKTKTVCADIIPKEKLSGFAANGTVFIDPRNKSDYADDHMPLAVNIPAFELQYNELTNALIRYNIPDKGAIILCYDKYSCEKACYLTNFLNDWSGGRFGLGYGLCPIYDETISEARFD